MLCGIKVFVEIVVVCEVNVDVVLIEKYWDSLVYLVVLVMSGYVSVVVVFVWFGFVV